MVVVVVSVVAHAEVCRGLFSAALKAEESARPIVSVAIPVGEGVQPLVAAAAAASAVVSLAVAEEVQRFVALQMMSFHGGFGAAQDESIWPVPFVGRFRYAACDLQWLAASFPYFVSHVEVSPDWTAVVGRPFGSHVVGVTIVQADVDARDHDRLRSKVWSAARLTLVRRFFGIVASTGEEGDGGHVTRQTA